MVLTIRRRILVYPIWASLALLEDTLQTPDSPRASTNSQLIQTLYSFLESTQRSQHCDLGYTVEGLSKISALATAVLPGQQMENSPTTSSCCDERPLEVSKFV